MIREEVYAPFIYSSVVKKEAGLYDKIGNLSKSAGVSIKRGRKALKGNAQARKRIDRACKEMREKRIAKRREEKRLREKLFEEQFTLKEYETPSVEIYATFSK